MFNLDTLSLAYYITTRCERCAVSLATRLMLGSAEEFTTIRAVCQAALDMEHDLFYT